MTSPYESVRVLWNPTDEAFFRIVGELFRPPFLRGASALLESNDEPIDGDDEPMPEFGADHARAPALGPGVP